MCKVTVGLKNCEVHRLIAYGVNIPQNTQVFELTSSRLKRIIDVCGSDAVENQEGRSPAYWQQHEVLVDKLITVYNSTIPTVPRLRRS